MITDLLIEGGDVIILDGQVAARALGGKLTKVTILAEGSIVPLVKTVIAKLHENKMVTLINKDINRQRMLRVLSKRAKRKGKEKDKDSVLKFAQSSERKHLGDQRPLSTNQRLVLTDQRAVLTAGRRPCT